MCLFGQESYRNNSFFKKYYSLKKLLELVFLSVCSPKIGLENLLENGDGSKVRCIKHHIHISSFSLLTSTTKNNREFKLKKLLLKKKKKHFYKTLFFLLRKIAFVVLDIYKILIFEFRFF